MLLVGAAAAQVRASADVALERVVRYGTVGEVQAAIARKADLSQRDDFGNTPLHWAAASQSGGKVRALLEAGADVNARNRDGQTALHAVILDDARWAPAVEALIDAQGLDLEAADEQGRTPLYLASQSSDLAWARRLLARGAKDSIFAAALRGDRAVVNAMLEGGANVNAPDKTGSTPLMLAARRGHVELLGELSRRGGKCDAADRDGRTPLMVAAHEGQLEVVDALLGLGADLNRVDRWGQTFVDYAIIRIRDRNGHESEKADALAQRALDDPRAKPSLRAVAFLWQANVARGVAAGPSRGAKDLKRAEALYRRAVAEAPQAPSGITAAWQLGGLMKEQLRPAETAKALIPLLVQDVTEPGLFGGRRMVRGPNPDYRHLACIEIAEAYMKMERYADALTYARLARDTFTYQTNCGTGFEEHLASVKDRVRRLETILSIARGGRN